MPGKVVDTSLACIFPQMGDCPSMMLDGSPSPDSSPRIKYELEKRGAKVSVEPGGSVLSGAGAALASLPLEQDAAYW